MDPNCPCVDLLFQPGELFSFQWWEYSSTSTVLLSLKTSSWQRNMMTWGNSRQTWMLVTNRMLTIVGLQLWCTWSHFVCRLSNFGWIAELHTGWNKLLNVIYELKIYFLVSVFEMSTSMECVWCYNWSDCEEMIDYIWFSFYF